MDPFQQITDTTGSGPFRYLADEHVSGSFAAYSAFAGYVPTGDRGTGLTAGAKVTHFDRVEWHTLPDAATATAALQKGEMDWFSQPPPELLELLRRDKGVVISALELLPYTLLLRFNSLNPPFNDAAMRRALLPAIDQSDFVQACVGANTEAGIVGTGVFPAGSDSASEAGLEPLRGPRSVELAREKLKEAGYAGQLVRIIGPTDILNPSALTQVGIDLFRRLGMNLDVQLTDWATVVARRPSKERADKGGWSVSFYSNPGFDLLNPATNAILRGNGAGAWFGWPTIPRLEELRDQWFDAAEPSAQKAITREMQVVAMRELPFIPLGGVEFVHGDFGFVAGSCGRVPDILEHQTRLRKHVEVLDEPASSLTRHGLFLVREISYLLLNLVLAKISAYTRFFAILLTWTNELRQSWAMTVLSVISIVPPCPPAPSSGLMCRRGRSSWATSLSLSFQVIMPWPCSTQPSRPVRFQETPKRSAGPSKLDT